MTEAVITQRELATVVVESSDTDVQAFAEGLPVERLPEVALRAAQIRRTLQRLEAACEARMIAAEISTWTDPVDEKVYDFIGRPDWELDDAEGLQRALAPVVPPRLSGPFQRAFTPSLKTSQAALNQIRDADERCAEVIAQYRVRKYGPPHLVEREAAKRG